MLSLKQMINIVLGLMLINVGLWGGSFLIDLTPPDYFVPSLFTGACFCLVGILLFIQGVEGD